MNPNPDKNALKQLREARRSQIERAKNTIKTQTALIKAIRAQLESGAKTIPQIADVLGMDTAQVLLYVAGLRKYGAVAEGPKDGDYYTYEMVSQKDG